MPTIKNIIIFIVIAIIFVLIYVYFIKKDTDTATLVSSVTPLVTSSGDTLAIEDNSAVAQEFLTLLLSVKSIKLDDAIFSDNAFISLYDSSITLIPDGNEGRINPFAPLGTDNPLPN
ncbi:hypothetical protein EXS45_00795 [Candidatus Nomurabacteria bacterium]|nr:hypothetical protein [Candidatus Nomurabacteria bacterium]